MHNPMMLNEWKRFADALVIAADRHTIDLRSLLRGLRGEALRGHLAQTRLRRALATLAELTSPPPTP